MLRIDITVASLCSLLRTLVVLSIIVYYARSTTFSSTEVVCHRENAYSAQRFIRPRSTESSVAVTSGDNFILKKPENCKFDDIPSLSKFDTDELRSFDIGLSSVDEHQSHESASSPPSSTRNLPPLEDATSENIEQQLPTFNEFHAMLSVDADKSVIKSDSSHVFPAADPEIVSNSLGSVPSSQSQEQGAESSSSDSHKTSSRNRSDPHGLETMSYNGSSISDPVKFKTNDISMNAAEEDSMLPLGSLGSGKGSSEFGQADNDVSSKGKHVKIQTAHSDEHVALRRNVAAVGCFAKLLEASKALKNPEAMLNENNDEYMNVPCSAEKWFVIEACEPVQLREIELANYELFSSRIKTFRVLISDRYPAKTWDVAGTFVARDMKGLQTFHLKSDKLIKYVKFELLEHYGSEHYCPLTMVRLFGRVADDLDEEDEDVAVQPPSESSVDTVESVLNAELGNVATKVQENRSTIASPDVISNKEINKPTEATYKPVSVLFPDTHNQSSLPSHIEQQFDIHNDFSGKPRMDEAHSHASPIHQNRNADLSREAVSLIEHGTTVKPGPLSTADCSSDSLHSCPSEGVISRMKPAQNDNKPSVYVMVNEHSVSQHDSTTSHPLDYQKLAEPNAQVHREGTCPMAYGNCHSSSLLMRIKNFLVSIFHGSSSVATNSDSQYRRSDTPGGEYNLSAVPVCPSHVAAIDSLLFYSLLNDSNYPNRKVDISVELSEAKQRSVSALASCFSQLDKLVRTSDSFYGSSVIAVRHRILLVPKNESHPAVSECSKASHLLGLSFFNGYRPCRPVSDRRVAADFSILELFIAYQYRTQFESIQDLLCYPSWQSWNVASAENLKSLRPHSHLMCPRLPDFLMQSSEPMSLLKENDNEPTDFHIQQSTNFTHHNAGTQPLLDSVRKEGIVVPAALAGSRKDTALMRLSNRLRLLERNVSVSMRYLEELSQSYRRQMDRLSRSFNLTTAWLKATAQGAEERDQIQLARITDLEKRLDELLVRIRSGSNDSVSGPDVLLTNLSGHSDIPVPIGVPTPPLPNFDPAPDWGASPNYDVWSQLTDDWSESDGIVETEDDCFIDFSRRLSNPSDAGYTSPKISLSHNYPSEADSRRWWERPLSWIPAVFSTNLLVNLRVGISQWSYVQSNFVWMLVVAVVHFGLAFMSHLVIYLTWLRPKYAKLLNNSCSVCLHNVVVQSLGYQSSVTQPDKNPHAGFSMNMIDHIRCPSSDHAQPRTKFQKHPALKLPPLNCSLMSSKITCPEELKSNLFITDQPGQSLGQAGSTPHCRSIASSERSQNTTVNYAPFSAINTSQYGTLASGRPHEAQSSTSHSESKVTGRALVNGIKRNFCESFAPDLLFSVNGESDSSPSFFGTTENLCDSRLENHSGDKFSSCPASVSNTLHYLTNADCAILSKSARRRRKRKVRANTNVKVLHEH